MRLELFVSVAQIQDFGTSLRVGDRIPIELLGHWGGGLGPHVQSMPAFQSGAGRKLLQRTGLVEHAFCGRILELRSLDDFGAPGVTYQECLLDCGVPVILVSTGMVSVSADNLDKPTRGDLAVGQYLSGVMMLGGRISFRYPDLIVRELYAEVTSLGILDLRPKSAAFGGIQSVESVDAYKMNQPLIVGVETKS